MKLPPELAHMPVCPKRDLPVPFIAEVGADGVAHFTVLDPQRHRECIDGRLCAMCGLPMAGEVTLLGDVTSLDSFWIEPPVHERCAELTVGGLCPYMSRELIPRRPHDASDPTIAVIGYRDVAELTEVGRLIAKRPTVMAIATRYMPAATQSNQGTLTTVFVTSHPVSGQSWVRRLRWFGWENGRAAETDRAGFDAALAAWEAAQAPPRRPVAAPQDRAQPRRTSRAQRRGGSR